MQTVVQSASMETNTQAVRVEVDRRSLADLFDLALRAGDSLQFADMALSDALRGSVTAIQAEMYLAE